MYSYKKLLKLVERMENAKSDAEIKAIAKEELIAWEIITNEIRNIARKLELAGILDKNEATNLNDAYNYCEVIRTNLKLIVEPSPFVNKSIQELIKSIRDDLGDSKHGYKMKLEWLIRDLGNKLKHVRKEFRLLGVEIGDLERLD